VISLRESCFFKERCGDTGHLKMEDGSWTRCTCLQLELNQKKLGAMYTENPKIKTDLEKMKRDNTIIEGPLATIRKHVARVLLDMSERGESFLTMDAYRLIEIFLEKDEEFETTSGATDADLLVLLLGFGDPRNRYLPELILQTISRRELIREPTWIILGLPMGILSTKYGEQLAEKLKTFKTVRAT